jgi:hypothetical protein
MRARKELNEQQITCRKFAKPSFNEQGALAVNWQSRF